MDQRDYTISEIITYDRRGGRRLEAWQKGALERTLTSDKTGLRPHGPGAAWTDR